MRLHALYTSCKQNLCRICLHRHAFAGICMFACAAFSQAPAFGKLCLFRQVALQRCTNRFFSATLCIIHKTEYALAARRAQQLTMQLPNHSAKLLRVGAGFLEGLFLPCHTCTPKRICLVSCERPRWLRKLMAPSAEVLQLGQPGHCAIELQRLHGGGSKAVKMH